LLYTFKSRISFKFRAYVVTNLLPLLLGSICLACEKAGDSQLLIIAKGNPPPFFKMQFDTSSNSSFGNLSLEPKILFKEYNFYDG